MSNSDKNKKNNINSKITWTATAMCFLVAVIIIISGYVFMLVTDPNYGFRDFVDSVVGNLIGVLAGFCVFDILYNKLTQDAYAKETSQQIAKTLMGDPETMDAFSEEDKKAFLKSTLVSMLRDDDAVDLLTTNMGKYFDGAKSARIRKAFDYNITLENTLTPEYEKHDFPGVKENRYYLLDEEFKFTVKYLSGRDVNFSGDYVCLGFAYDKRSLDSGLLEDGKDADFSKCIFNEDLVVTPEAIKYINSIPNDEITSVINDLFVPTLWVDGDGGREEDLVEVERKQNGLIFKFRLDYDKTSMEHIVRIYFKMPRLWDHIFEVTLVDPTKNPHIKLKYKSDMDVTMYSYLNKEDQSNAGAFIKRADLYEISIKDEWVYPKSGALFHIRRKI
ncbi:MAG: hypothetical protein ILP17_03815 [Lachnospiraceae bacterium]|nr:hypothetical protein [Lachnospiraceae bacterium]MBP1584798.1 hypothetical protein [Lachnospiraceae bacterium]